MLCIQENGTILVWYALCSVERRNADVVCFVFRGKAGSGSDEDADCSVMCSRECQNARNSQH